MGIVTTTLVDALGMLKDWVTKTGIQEPLDTKDYNATKENIKSIKSGTLTGITKNLVVEPTIIVSNNVRNSKIFDQLVALNMDLFTCFYTQAFQILTDVLGQAAITAIDVLGTNKYTGAAMEKYVRNRVYNLVLESMDKPFCLGDLDFSNPMFLLNQEEKEGLEKEYKSIFNMEAKPSLPGNVPPTPGNQPQNQPAGNNRQINNNVNTTSTVAQGNGPVTRASAKGFDKNAITDRISMYDGQMKSMYESLNQVLVRTVNVKAQRDKGLIGKPGTDGQGILTSEFVIPITIIGTVKVVPIDEIIVAVSNYDFKKSFTYRFREWQSGGISLGDLIFATDLIKEYKSNKLSKNSKLMTDIEDKRNTSNIRKAVTGIQGAEVSYNMIMVTDYELEMLEKAYNKKLDNFNSRQAFLKVMNAHNLSVVNDDAERINIYIADINGGMDIGFGKLQKRNDKDINMLEFFRAMAANTAPRF
nr:MAG TPA: hypothetical protein [Caudoviricetes sp.]